jgi:hypothetical protein
VNGFFGSRRMIPEIRIIEGYILRPGPEDFVERVLWWWMNDESPPRENTIQPILKPVNTH